MIYQCVVLCGGDSPERQISLSSGFAVTEALSSLHYKVALFDPALGRKGLYSWPADTESIKNARHYKDRRIFLDALHHLIQSKNFSRQHTIFFIALHGTWGEDGQVQALLESFECFYTGSGFMASALAMNKSAAKALVKSSGVAVSEGIEISGQKIVLDPHNAVKKALSSLKMIDPEARSVVVKPTCQGSSIAAELLALDNILSIVDAVKKAHSYSSSVLVEIFIEGREFTAGILEDQALPLIEICAKNQFSDFENKYNSKVSAHRCPVNLPKYLETKIKQAALIAHQTIGAKSFSRIDFRLNRHEKFFFLELNTLPGLTLQSLLPKAAEASGIDFKSLCQKILLNAQNKN